MDGGRCRTAGPTVAVEVVAAPLAVANVVVVVVVVVIVVVVVAAAAAADAQYRNTWA